VEVLKRILSRSEFQTDGVATEKARRAKPPVAQVFVYVAHAMKRTLGHKNASDGQLCTILSRPNIINIKNTNNAVFNYLYSGMKSEDTEALGGARLSEVK